MNTSDPTYQDAAIRALARSIVALYRGLIEEGMPRKEALQVVLTWVANATTSNVKKDSDGSS